MPLLFPTEIEPLEEITTKLLCLFPLRLKDADLYKIDVFLNMQNITTFSELQTCLAEEQCKGPFVPKTLDYLKLWLALGACLSNNIASISNLWRKEVNKAFGSDELVPLLMELLPNNKDLLTTLQKNLLFATKISSSSMYACHLTNLYVALECKLTTEPIAPKKEILQLASEIKRLSLVSHLNKICLKYLDELLTYCREKSGQALPVGVIDRFFAQTIFPPDKETAELVNQYQLIWDLQQTLIREKTTSAHKLREFNAKFNHLHNILKMKASKSFLQKIGEGIKLDVLHDLLWGQSTEKFYAHTLGLFSHKLENNPSTTLEEYPEPKLR